MRPAGLPSGNGLGRDGEPVVLTGADLPGFAGVEPGLLVAFRCEGAWEQVPLQVDERAVLDFGSIYGWDPSGYTVKATTRRTRPPAALRSRTSSIC